MNGKLEGFEGKFPSLSDWEDHVTVAFPEVRLKQYLEMSIEKCRNVLEINKIFSRFFRNV